MIDIFGLALLRPWWLLGLAVAALVVTAAVRRSGGVGDWRLAVDPHLLDAIARRGGVVAGKGRGALAAAATVALIAIALVGPAAERGDAATFRNLDTVIVVLDLSRSVAESPQFRDAKVAALAAAEAAGARQVAVIAFAGDAYLVAPPTTDRKGLETTLFALDGQTVPDFGSAPARALGLARRTLKDAGAVGGDVVLITDGGGIDDGARGEARGLAADGNALHTLFVEPKTATDGPPGPKATGRPELESLASLGGGASGTVEDHLPVDEKLASRPADRLGAGAYASLVWYDYGRWLLALAAVPALLLFRRGG
ncbi:vWA domain-containing protein [Chenggangzhangella methanolivorans]|uniref:VWA domain-containing protein n=1 Tax=Chenggangzhangella methanolivorans TaxID=1437009 RepID=A0A9E6R8T6_9HYPH|nr:VWA domain-containing protein [Chenggangzhangella methanolivorans]QZN99919.1 VWA domain-containing protein [Chenggangzhangella methanolivorans]